MKVLKWQSTAIGIAKIGADMTLLKPNLLGPTILVGLLTAQSAFAESSIQVVGDQDRQVRVTIERIDSDGDTVIQERTGGGYSIHENTEDGRLVRVELVEDDEDGNAQTRVCIIEEDEGMDCSGEALLTHRRVREDRRAERAEVRERVHAAHAAARAEHGAEMETHRSEMAELHDRHAREREEHRRVLRLHTESLQGLHAEHGGNVHFRRGGGELSDRELERLDEEMDRLRDELRSLRRQLDQLGSRDRSDLHDEHDKHDGAHRRMTWVHDDEMEFSDNVHVEVIELHENDGEITIELAPHADEDARVHVEERRFVIRTDDEGNEVVIDLAPQADEDTIIHTEERRWVMLDEDDSGATITKTIELIIENDEIVELERLEQIEEHIVIDLDEGDSVRVIEIKQKN